MCEFQSNLSSYDLQCIEERSKSISTLLAEEPEEDFALHDLSGVELPFELVAAARREEMDHMLGYTFHVVDRSECIEKTGKPPISTRWIDTDKSHGQGVMKVRSRFVARDFKRGERSRGFVLRYPTP